MKTNVKRVLVSAAVAVLVGPIWASGSFAATGGADLQVTAQQTLVAKMGNDTRDIQIEVTDRVVNLSGWTAGPAQGSKAQALVSRVPGICQSYSTMRTWSTDGSL
jgi:hypothetical protein